MGNALSPCLTSNGSSGSRTTVKLIVWGDAARTFPTASSRPIAAEELIAEFPNRTVCHAGSFYIGRPVPALSAQDELEPGETYILVPADRLPTCGILTASSVAPLLVGPSSRSAGRSPICEAGSNPFERVKTAQGEALIKISEEFLTKAATGGSTGDVKKGAAGDCYTPVLCSTPELKKHYDQLVGLRTSPWSPKLETILECKCIRSSRSPVRTWSPHRPWTSRRSS